MSMKPIQCGIERYPTGGEGVFHLSPAQMLLPALAGEYAGAIKLIYLDPPFRTGGDFYMRTDGKIAALPAYTDTLSNDAYLALMREILGACHTLLSPEGSLYLHVDYRMAAPLRLMLDELFGPGNFMNEIIWAYKSGGRSTRFFPRKHDTILFYRKTRRVYFNIAAVGARRGPERRNHMKRTVDSEGRVSYSIRSGGKVYVYHEDTPVYPSDVWTDIEHLHQRAPERLGYGTQKPEALLSRIVLASSAPNDIVADFFSGSGTTAAVAAKTGRRFLACDSSPYALYTIRKRLMASAHALTAPSAPLTLRYPAEAPAFHVRAEIAPEADACVCTVEGPDDLLYCALGVMNEGAFTPLVSSYSPRAPFTLRMPACAAPVLHAVDGMGRQGFWAWRQ